MIQRHFTSSTANGKRLRKYCLKQSMMERHKAQPSTLPALRRTKLCCSQMVCSISGIQSVGNLLIRYIQSIQIRWRIISNCEPSRSKPEAHTSISVYAQPTKGLTCLQVIRFALFPHRMEITSHRYFRPHQ